jgi:hypothetical protein
MKILQIQPTATDSFELGGSVNTDFKSAEDLSGHSLNPDDFKETYTPGIGTFFKATPYEEEFNIDDAMFYKHKIYKCPIDSCTKFYSTSENMKLHYKTIHLKLKPYKCTFCDSAFTHRNGKLVY